jgi:hypothetical protein
VPELDCFKLSYFEIARNANTWAVDIQLIKDYFVLLIKGEESI